MGSGGVCTVDDVVEFLSWGLSVQDDAGSAVEAVLDVLDLGVWGAWCFSDWGSFSSPESIE